MRDICLRLPPPTSVHIHIEWQHIFAALSATAVAISIFTHSLAFTTFVDSFVRPFVTAIIHAPDTCTSSFMRAARKLLNNVQNSCRPLVVVVVAVDVVPPTQQQQQQQLIAHAYS